MATFVLSAFADEAGASLATQINALKRNNIGYIEPRHVDGKNVSYMSEEELKALKKSLDEARVKVSSLGSPIGKYPITDPFEPHMESFRSALLAAQILGTDRMRMFSFFCPQTELHDHREEVLSRLCQMVEQARQAGVTLCHENEAAIYGQMPSEVADLMQNVPGLKAVFDPANYRMANADITCGLEASLPALSYLHIKDAIFSEQIIVPAGEGEGQIPFVLDKVDRLFSGTIFLTVEPHLKVFDAYKDIDQHELRGKYTFSSGEESFDFAVNALKGVLTNLGFTENEHREWTRNSN